MKARNDIPSGLLELLKEIDQWAAGREHDLELIVTGSSAISLAYAPEIQTKDIDVLRVGTDAMKDLMSHAGRGSDLHTKTGYYLEEVPPIFPAADGLERRARTVEGLPTSHIQVRVLDPHDLIVSKLKRFAAGDQEHIRALCQLPEFDEETLLARYRQARSQFIFDRDILEKLDRSFSVVWTDFLGNESVQY